MSSQFELPALLAGPVIGVRARQVSMPRELELLDSNGDKVGDVVSTAPHQTWGNAAQRHWRVTDLGGQIVCQLDAPGAWRRPHFVVVDAAGGVVGEFHKIRSLSGSGFLLVAPDGSTARMHRPALQGLRWLIEDAGGHQLGQVSLQRPGLLHAFTTAPTYVLELADLAGEMRVLALAACICLNVFDAPNP